MELHLEQNKPILASWAPENLGCDTDLRHRRRGGILKRITPASPPVPSRASGRTRLIRPDPNPCPGVQRPAIDSCICKTVTSAHREHTGACTQCNTRRTPVASLQSRTHYPPGLLGIGRRRLGQK
ncbi:hypothetical protein EYF80_042969 [Liparis tanakae]|uniref:Uncharacterized protein n=1 Tax=Liparis tanakae TaxID=230148 RepID=A0A4Z2FZY1_9TELE|nr:hypothetical protein EYF80_042969 [Liparis tanakae]